MLELRAVTKRWGETVGLARVDLLIRPGRTTVLLGPSGCGKSTVLRLFVGLVQPDEGEVRFAGEPLGAHNLRAARLRMGYVIQDGGLFPHLTSSDNVCLLARHLGWEPARIAARIEELASLARLPSSLLQRYPAQLSGGQRQRVALVRALFVDPEVLLLDEPLGALDPLVRVELQEDLARVATELGKTMVVVTHDISEAAFFADHVVLLREGQVIQEGPLEALFRSPADPFVTRFLKAQRPPLPFERAEPA